MPWPRSIHTGTAGAPVPPSEHTEWTGVAPEACRWADLRNWTFLGDAFSSARICQPGQGEMGARGRPAVYPGFPRMEPAGPCTRSALSSEPGDTERAPSSVTPSGAPQPPPQAWPTRHLFLPGRLC